MSDPDTSAVHVDAVKYEVSVFPTAGRTLYSAHRPSCSTPLTTSPSNPRRTTEGGVC